MQVLWREQPLAAEHVVAALASEQHWQEATVKTLLNRLLGKGAIAAEEDGRRYLYRPVLAREEYVARESKTLIDRLFDGRLAPLVQHFSECHKLSKQDISELKRLIRDFAE